MNDYYVYGLFYEDENHNEVCFYIGKGKSEHRMETHLYPSGHRHNRNIHKTRKIKKLRKNDKEPYPKKIYTYLSEKESLFREWALINIMYPKLTNIRRGYYGKSRDRSGKNNPHYGHTHSKETIKKLKEQKAGSKNPMVGNGKLNKEQAAKVKWLAKNGEIYQKKIAEKYNVSQQLVSNIKHERRWKHVTPKSPKK